MQQKQNEIELEQNGAVTIFNIRGDLTAFSEQSLSKAYQEATAQGSSKLLLKFDQDAYINSGGIAILIQILAQTRKNRQAIAITGISEHFKKIFHMVGITKFAGIHDGVEKALESLSAAS
jgi:anti-anti-sigma factor